MLISLISLLIGAIVGALYATYKSGKITRISKNIGNWNVIAQQSVFCPGALILDCVHIPGKKTITLLLSADGDVVGYTTDEKEER